jgi:hypothetical protein
MLAYPERKMVSSYVCMYDTLIANQTDYEAMSSVGVQKTHMETYVMQTIFVYF